MQSGLNKFGASQEKESCQEYESSRSLSSIDAPVKGKRRRANEREALRTGGECAVGGKASSLGMEVPEGEAVGASKSVANKQQEVKGGRSSAGCGALGPSVVETEVTEGGKDDEKTGAEGVAGARVSSSLQEMEKAAKSEETFAGESEPEPRASTDLESFRYQGPAKRRKGENEPAQHRPAEAVPPQHSPKKAGASPASSDAPTPSGALFPAVESVAVDSKDDMRLFKQFLKQRLPPPVRPFGTGGGTFFVGTSGWDYKDWKGAVYPEKMVKKDWFSHYCSVFNTVEVNNTFYRLPPPEVFEAWGRQAPEGFSYALKFTRFGSHMKKLMDPQGTVGLFVERAAHLGGSLQGPVLVQLPPRFRANAPRLDEFLQQVPSGARWAVEMRDPSWLCEDVYTVLRRHNAALCIHDHKDIGGSPHPTVLTADWTYVRFHGPKGDYQDGYDRGHLSRQAEWIRGLLLDGKDVYAYFNNDVAGNAIFDAQELRSRVMGETT